MVETGERGPGLHRVIKQRIDEEGRVADLPRGEFGSVADRRVDEGSVAA